MSSAIAPLMSILGERETGQDVRSSNITAAQGIANMLKSSLGPQGLDKLLVDDVGDVTVSNDGATILKLLEVKHPAARVLVELSQLQDQEVGDGTTSVVLIAAELLRRANQLVQSGIHPTSVIAGYKVALKEAIKYIQQHLSENTETLGEKLLLSVAHTTLNSKYIGAEADHFARIVVDAITKIKITIDGGIAKYPVKAINIVKSHGSQAKDSFLYHGYVLERTSRASLAMPQTIHKAKIAFLDFNLRQHRMQLGVQIQVTDPLELEKIREKERDITKSKIEKILAAGANVILTTQGIDDMALKYFVEAKTMAVRRVPKQDIRRLARCTQGTVCLTLSTLEHDEKFDPVWLGECEEVYEERIGDNDFLHFKNPKATAAMTIVLRGANEPILDEMERSVHDALCAVSKVCESKLVCAGGGAIETALSVYLEDFARTLGSKEQLAIAEFAEALLIIPKTLAVNGAKDSLDLLGTLKHQHHQYQLKQSTDQQAKWFGLNFATETKTRNNLEAGVIEPSQTKIKAIRFATEAAITILRIDDVIKIQSNTGMNEES